LAILVLGIGVGAAWAIRDVASDDSAVFRDDFTDEVATGWTVMNEVTSRWAVADGHLRFNPSASRSSELENVFLRWPDLDAYEITTRLDFKPTQDFQAAGLIVYQDSGNLIQLVQAFCSRRFESCADNGVYFDNVHNFGVPTNQGGRALSEQPEHLYLRIEVDGDVYSGSYGFDGKTWIDAGTISRSLGSPRVGIVARRNDPTPPISLFDFFEIDG